MLILLDQMSEGDLILKLIASRNRFDWVAIYFVASEIG